MRLDLYHPNFYHPGAPLWKQVLWFYLGQSFLQNRWIPSSAAKCCLLRWFGAQIGYGVRIKPGLRVKFPWRLSIGDYVWLGEDTWIDNLAPVTIESQVCISQAVYLCTGNHDWSRSDFQLQLGEIYIGQGSWLAARSAVAPGVTIHQNAILCMGAVATQNLQAGMIYAGNPARQIKSRFKLKSKTEKNDKQLSSASS